MEPTPPPTPAVSVSFRGVEDGDVWIPSRTRAEERLSSYVEDLGEEAFLKIFKPAADGTLVARVERDGTVFELVMAQERETREEEEEYNFSKVKRREKAVIDESDDEADVWPPPASSPRNRSRTSTPGDAQELEHAMSRWSGVRVDEMEHEFEHEANC